MNAADVVRPLLDFVVPPARELAVRRARNLAVVGALLAALVPRSAAFGAVPDTRWQVVALLFGVAALWAHFVRRRWWGPWAAAAALVLPVAAHGLAPRPWALGVAAVAWLTLVATVLRTRDEEEFPDERLAPRGLAGFAWSFVGVLVFREFAVLPIHVPTGSMQPTIYGRRVHAGGDHLAVDRVRYLRGDPQRWDVAVFDFPLHRPTEFVKRVIGLPGETVEIRDGDVWIDGRIAAKPPLVQESLWQEVFPKPNARGQAKTLAAGWHAAGGAAGRGWSLEGDVVRCETSDGKERALVFTPRLTHGDVRVRFGMEPPRGSGRFYGVRIRSRGTVVEARAGAGSGDPTTTLTIDGADAGSGAGSFDEFRILDGVASASLGGREIVRAEVPLGGAGGRHGLELLAYASVRFVAPEVHQDLVHLPAADGTALWKVPEASYFVLGDNARSSEDSRGWTVTELRVRGRAEPLRAPPTYPGEVGQPVSNLRRTAAGWTFEDVSGVPRRVPLADVEGVREGVAAPFVPRDHFLGRAALVFWPWVPAEGGFRPRLLP